MEDKERQILGYIKKADKRIKVQILIDKTLLGIFVGALLGAVLTLLSLFTPFYEGIFLGIFFLTSGLVGGLVIALFTFPNIKKQALILDSKGLNERVTTSLELMGQEEGYARLQKEDTIEELKKLNIKKTFPIKVNKKMIAYVLTALILFSLGAFLPTSAKSQGKELWNLKKEQKELTKKIEEEKKKVEENKKLTEEEKTKLKEILEKNKMEIAKAQNKEELKKTMERIDKKLSQEKKESKNEEVKKSLDSIRNSLNPKAEEERKKNNEKDLEALKDALNKNKDTKELAKALESKNQEDIDNELNKLSDALKNMGDLERGEISNTLGEASSDVSDEDLKELLENLSNEARKGQLSDKNKKATAKAIKDAQDGSLSESNGSSEGEGEGSGNGQGNGQGNGSGSGQGSGSGSGAGQGSGSGQGWNYGSKNGNQGDSSDKSGEQVYIPGRNEGGDENLTGEKGQTGNSQTGYSNNGINERGGSVNLDSIIGDYSKEAIEGLERNSIPDYLKDIIKEYFEELQ